MINRPRDLLIDTAAATLRRDLPLPTDLIARLLAAGVDVAELERKHTS